MKHDTAFVVLTRNVIENIQNKKVSSQQEAPRMTGSNHDINPNQLLIIDNIKQMNALITE